MPAGRTNQTAYIAARSTIEGFNESSMYKGGELGSHIVTEGGAKEYQYVQCDSGATASTGSGVVAAGDLAFWKNKTTYIVTNDIAQALGAVDATNDNKRNNVAGIFRVAATAGNFCVIQLRGRSNVLAAAGGTYDVGNTAIAGDTTVSDITTVAAGTATTHTAVGLVAGARGAEVAGQAPVDLSLPIVP